MYKMQYFVKLNLFDTSSHGRFRQTFAECSNPAVYQGVVGVEDPPHNPKRSIGHGIKQDAKRLLGRNFFACAGIAFPKIASAFFAAKP
jgi:hypothetical protein